nr:bifunctional nicotinamidase/pyrazinamidase [Parachlamydia sp. AcF125]
MIVDVQNDFLPGGALAVKEGDQIIPFVNQLIQLPFNTIVATQDWHPHDHLSFAVYHHKPVGEHIKLLGIDQILWPVHCVQGTRGACFPDSLASHSFMRIFYKGTDRSIDSYSAFFDNGHCKSTGLETYLKERGVQKLYIAGLATDYCIKYTALDAKNLGFQVYVIADACRAVNLRQGDEEMAFREMHDAGIRMLKFSEINLSH